MRSFLGRGPLPDRVDIVIIGGGANGVALARECARARKSVLIVESNDFASGTTSRCTRIVHGGLHYLEKGELGLLRESLRGRETLLCEHPHLVHPLDFVLAVSPSSRYSSVAIRAALWLYRKIGRAPMADDSEVRAACRSLNPAQRWTAYSYQDAYCDYPERLVADWLVEACAAGVIARNHSELLAIRTSEGRIRGILVRDSVHGREHYVETEWVINATGPWVDTVRDTTGLSAPTPLISGLRGTYIMLRRWPGAPTVGLHTIRLGGRPISIAPWNGMLQVGSTETVDGGDPMHATPGREEVERLLSCVAGLFPEAKLTAKDIAFSYSGVRPVPYRADLHQSGGHPTKGIGTLAFRSVLHNHADEGALGMLSVFGGSLTTAESLASKTARTMGLSREQTSGPQVAIGKASGVENTLQQWASAVHASTGIPQQSAEAVARWHGRHAMCIIQTAMHDAHMRLPIVEGQPQLVAQAVEAVAYEHAVTLADILLRRVPMALDQDWNEESTIQAAARIAPVLHWNERRREEEIAAFEEERSRFLHKPRNLKSPTEVAA